MNHDQSIILAIVVGSIYYFNMVSSLEDEPNCSFMANKLTDIGAFIYGIALMYLGLIKYDDPILSAMGASIITGHVWQLFHKM